MLFTLSCGFLSAIDRDVVPAKSLEQLQAHIHYNTEGPNIIGHLIIEDHSSTINDATWFYIKKGLDYYKQTKPLFVILELNTPGGEVFAAQKISDALKEFDTQYGIPVVCYINNWAISAGAMLAYSCRFIAVVKDGTMGAAEPIIMGEGVEMKPASEKINSALRADFASRAHFFDRNPYIAEAMVDKDLILVVRDGQVVKLNNESQVRFTGPDADLILSSKGKLLTLDAEEMLKYGVADVLLLPTKTEFITDEERANGRWPAKKMLLFQAPFFNQIPEAVVDAYEMDWKSKLFAFLATPVVSSLLLLGLFLGFYIELSTPGFGIAGAIAFICLTLIILSSFALEIANWLEVVLLFGGLLILLFDFFILPTFGLMGFFGLLLFLGGLFGLLLPGLGSINYEFDTQTFNAAGEAVLNRLAWFSGTIILAGVIIAFLARYLTPRLLSFAKLVLSGHEQDASEGYVASKFDAAAIGKHGTVLTDLRPGGYILVDGEKHQAISIEGYIFRGSEVEVIGGQEESLMVKEFTARNVQEKKEKENG